MRPVSRRAESILPSWVDATSARRDSHPAARQFVHAASTSVSSSIRGDEPLAEDLGCLSYAAVLGEGRVLEGVGR